jgi:UDP-3-O-[3-hydroxymyristoyl] glucosamine N-acyltransferase
MRSMSLPILALSTLLTLPVFAGDTGKQQASAQKEASPPKEAPKSRVRCAVQSRDGSRAVQGADLILESGEKAKDAVAIDGNVIIRKGAIVKDVVAVHGKVIIEEGAEVKGDAVSLGGELHLQKNARVKGDAVALGGSLRIDDGASVGGEKFSFSVNVNGTDLAQSFIQKALEDSDCSITLDDDDEDDKDGDD